MCPNNQYTKSIALARTNSYKVSRTFFRLLLLFVFTTMLVKLSAQNMSEDYLAVKNWKMPQEAKSLSELKAQDKLLYWGEEAYSGWIYELYPEGELMRAAQYENGKQHGLNLLWYPDGNPQMSANYRNGALHGRFLGWYQNGFVIYDMFLNRGTYASDNLVDSDDRQQEEAEIYEREGSTDDGTSE